MILQLCKHQHQQEHQKEHHMKIDQVRTHNLKLANEGNEGKGMNFSDGCDIG
jgi:hypothetical protein